MKKILNVLVWAVCAFILIVPATSTGLSYALGGDLLGALLCSLILLMIFTLSIVRRELKAGIPCAHEFYQDYDRETDEHSHTRILYCSKCGHEEVWCLVPMWQKQT